MSIISKVIKTVFGDKSAKDRKLIWPIVEQINEFQSELDSLSDEHLIKKYSDLKIELSELIKIKKNEFESSGIEDDDIDDKLNEIESNFLDEKLIEVFAIVKESAKQRRKKPGLGLGRTVVAAFCRLLSRLVSFML